MPTSFSRWDWTRAIFCPAFCRVQSKDTRLNEQRIGDTFQLADHRPDPVTLTVAEDQDPKWLLPRASNRYPADDDATPQQWRNQLRVVAVPARGRAGAM